jgi:hypothetical protein
MTLIDWLTLALWCSPLVFALFTGETDLQRWRR